MFAFTNGGYKTRFLARTLGKIAQLADMISKYSLLINRTKHGSTSLLEKAYKSMQIRPCLVNHIPSRLSWIEINFNLYSIYSTPIHSNPGKAWCNRTCLRDKKNYKGA
jgi:hypothetical protein